MLFSWALLSAQSSHHYLRDQMVNLHTLPRGEEDPTPAVLCPVHALSLYLDRTQRFRSSEKLFICFEEQ